MPIRRAWLPREGHLTIFHFHDFADDATLGFTADVAARVVRNTVLNPALTLPLLLFAHYTGKGRELSTGHETALRRLQCLLYIGIARVLNGFLSKGFQNNWQGSKYDWEKEVAVITGGSDGIGKNVSFLLAEKGVKVASLDMQPPTFESRESLALPAVSCCLTLA